VADVDADGWISKTCKSGKICAGLNLGTLAQSNYGYEASARNQNVMNMVGSVKD
jgi:hypothetical protein